MSLTPESDDEKAKLTALWKIMIDCVGDSGKMVPVGEYIPEKGNKSASFYIEGVDPQDSSFTEVRVDRDESVYCKTCNKLINLKAGQVIPICCGKIMDVVD